VSIQAQELSAAHVAAHAANSELLARLGAMDLLQMSQAPVTQQYTVIGDEIGRVEQQQVHGRGAGGWSLVSAGSSSASPRNCASRVLIMLPQITPASNNSHIGIASKD